MLKCFNFKLKDINCKIRHMWTPFDASQSDENVNQKKAEKDQQKQETTRKKGRINKEATEKCGRSWETDRRSSAVIIGGRRRCCRRRRRRSGCCSVHCSRPLHFVTFTLEEQPPPKVILNIFFVKKLCSCLKITYTGEIQLPNKYTSV